MIANLESRGEPYVLTTDLVMSLLIVSELLRMFIRELQQVDQQRVLENDYEEKKLAAQLEEDRLNEIERKWRENQ